jgi:hypothetical protein
MIVCSFACESRSSSETPSTQSPGPTTGAFVFIALPLMMTRFRHARIAHDGPTLNDRCADQGWIYVNSRTSPPKTGVPANKGGPYTDCCMPRQRGAATFIGRAETTWKPIRKRNGTVAFRYGVW